MPVFLNLNFSTTELFSSFIMWSKQQNSLICISVLLISCRSIQAQYNNNVDQKLNVDIYYESVCPDSHAFISRQLIPNWPNIKDYVNITFVPFGKSASFENGKKFVCQHGSAECKGNRIMSCGLSRIPDQTQQVLYVACMMDVLWSARISGNSADEYGQECATVLELDYNEIMTNCYGTREGTLRQLEAENATKKIVYPNFFVPTIIFNGVYQQNLQDESLRNFPEVVCKLRRRSDPNACSHKLH